MSPISRSSLIVLGLAGSLFIQASQAQLVDETQVSPTVPGGTIGKSLEEQVGAGRGDVTTPQSSVYLIKRDPARSIPHCCLCAERRRRLGMPSKRS